MFWERSAMHTAGAAWARLLLIPFRASGMNMLPASGSEKEGNRMFERIYLRHARKLRIGFFSLMIYAAMC